MAVMVVTGDQLIKCIYAIDMIRLEANLHRFNEALTNTYINTRLSVDEFSCN